MPGEEDFDSQEHVAEAEGQEPGHPHPDITPVPEPFEDAEEQAIDKSHYDLPESAVEEAPVEAAPLPESTMKWFILHTYSGFEEKVKESLLTRGQAFGFGDQIGQILIPKEDVIELRNGKKVTTKRLVYPGYVLVEMEMNADDARRTPASEDDVRKERERPHRRRTVYEFLRQGGRSQYRTEYPASAGDHLWAGNAGGTGLLSGGKKLKERFQQGLTKDGEEGYRFSKAANSSGQGDARTAGGHRSRPAGREHHGILQGVQCEDIG